MHNIINFEIDKIIDSYTIVKGIKKKLNKFILQNIHMFYTNN